jgi:tetratricopeptide (TPR) repeat protein
VHEKVGRVLEAQGDSGGAVKSYRDGIAIAERLVAADSANREWQHELSHSHARIGDLLAAQRKFDDALAAYRAATAVMERLATAEPGEEHWQDDLAAALDKIGDLALDQDSLDDALKVFRESLAIRARLADTDQADPRRQFRLATSHERVGDVYRAQKKREDALDAYQKSRAIFERLAAADPDSAQRQRDLWISYHRLASVLSGPPEKLAEALTLYRDSLAIAERQAGRDGNDIRWQHDLAVTHERIGDVLDEQDNLDDAAAAYRASLTVREWLAEAAPDDADRRRELLGTVGKLGDLAYKLLLAGQFAAALECADQAIALAPEQIWIQTNRAHALMFLGRVDDARALYLRYRGERLEGDRSWEAVVIEDFAELRRAGHTHRIMREIETLFGSKG